MVNMWCGMDLCQPGVFYVLYRCIILMKCVVTEGTNEIIPYNPGTVLYIYTFLLRSCGNTKGSK
jgi:hypothetical protein